MHKITNFTGSAARHGWEKMAPSSFVTSRPSPANVVTDAHVLPASKRPLSGTPHSPSNPTDAGLNLCFNVPFSSNLAGPDGDDILHASPRALDRWLHPEGTPEGTPTYKLPIHARNLETLRQLCREACEGIGHPKLDATVTSSEPKGVSPLQRPSHKGLVTNVCLSGDAETVQNMRGRILKETPLALVCVLSCKLTLRLFLATVVDGRTPRSTRLLAQGTGRANNEYRTRCVPTSTLTRT